MLREVYQYVDYTSKFEVETDKGDIEKKFYKWRRVIESDMPAMVAKLHNQDVFQSVQRFRLSTRKADEDHYCGPFFDFDSDNLESSKQDAIKVLDFFINLGIPHSYLSCFFSGSRGFHVYVEPEVFGIAPSSSLTYTLKLCCQSVAAICKLSCFDNTIYSVPRMWRLPNTVNTKLSTRSYKIELAISELRSMNEADIRELAKNPRTVLHRDMTDGQPIQPEFAWWWKQWADEYQNYQAAWTLRPKRSPTFADIPSCVQDILDNSLKIAGTRNKATIVLATYCKAKGMSADEAIAFLSDWIVKIPNDMTSADARSRLANVKSVVSSVYDKVGGNKYNFACSYVRSLGNLDKPINCTRDQCKYNEYGEVAEPREIKLEDSTRACYEGMPIKTEGLVAGMDYSPHLIPAVVKFHCSPPERQVKDSPCQSCGLLKHNYNMELRISPNDPDILGMVDVSSDNVKSILYRKARIHKPCRLYRMDIIESQNVRTVHLVPMMRFTPETIGKERSYALVLAKFVGHDVSVNEAYEVTGYLYPDPKQQYAMLLLNSMKTKALTWQESLPDDAYDKLKIFQTDGDPLDKINEIWNDLENNVARIYGRRLLGYAIDLVYHSVVSFFFADQKDFVRRGWTELLIYGDTDTGKTQMARTLSTHYQLGAFASCETTRRTGLTYSIQEPSVGKWIVVAGILPLNDRGLVWLDEFRELPEDDRKELTQMRLDGVLNVAGAGKASLPCRVRIIYIAGPKRAMKEYDYGIESIFEVYREREDIRRLDLVAILGTDDVDPNIFHSKRTERTPHIYTTELCNLLIRWVWNLDADEITFTQDAIDEVYVQVKILTDKFSDSIPLLKIEDLRYKMARLSAALAARLFNTKDKGRSLTVERKHIIAVCKILDELYSTPTCGFSERSKSERRRQRMEYVNRDEAKYSLKVLIPPEQLSHFRDMMLENKTFTKTDIEEQMGWDRSEGARIFKEMSRLRLFKKLPNYKGYAKTPVLIDILREMEAAAAADKRAELPKEQEIDYTITEEGDDIPL